MVKTCVRRTNAFNCGLGLFHVVACPQLNLLHSSFSCDFHIFIVDVTIFCRRVYSLYLSKSLFIFVHPNLRQTAPTKRINVTSFYRKQCYYEVSQLLHYKSTQCFPHIWKKNWCWKRSFAVCYRLSVWMSWYVSVWASVWSVAKDYR